MRVRTLLLFRTNFGPWDLVSVGIKEDDFGTFAMKRESAVGPFYQKLVLLRYFPKYGTFTSVLK